MPQDRPSSYATEVAVYRNPASESLQLFTGASLTELAHAFTQLGASAASGMFGRYDAPAKIVAACWKAHGLGVHPSVFMDGVDPIMFGQTLVMVPKWDFEVGLLRERLPGFKFNVIEETDERCVIEFSVPGEVHRVEYTMADAERQGHKAKNPLYRSSSREMLFKQCVHRGVRRIGAHVLRGIGGFVDQMDAAVSDSNARVLDDPDKALERAARVEHQGEDYGKRLSPPPVDGAPAASAPIAPAPVEAKPVEDHRAKLMATLKERYPGKNRRELLASAGDLVTMALGDATERKYTRVDQIGPVEAQRALAFLAEKYPLPPKSSGAAVVEEDEPYVEVDEDAGAPPVDETPAPAAPVAAADPNSNLLDGSWEGFVQVVQKMRKSHPGRPILKESPPNSGRMYLADQQVLEVIGYDPKRSYMVFDNGAIIVGKPELARIARLMLDMTGTPVHRPLDAGPEPRRGPTT